MTNKIALRPSYWASVSGGKDSLFMLKLILSNLDKYPLDGVVHFELEIYYPFIKNVIDYMESECRRFGITFLRIKPRQSWEELYNTISSNGNQYGFPTRTTRWCNSNYKLDAPKQLDEFMAKQGYYVVSYIGYCADEEKRFAKRVDSKRVERYPLVEENIYEDTIWKWAKTQPIFNHYYDTNKRFGCMYCPMSSYLNYAYLYKYYPDNFAYMIEKMRETEKIRESELGRPFSVISSNPKYNSTYLEKVIKQKYIFLLNRLENQEQLCFFDFVDIVD